MNNKKIGGVVLGFLLVFSMINFVVAQGEFEKMREDFIGGIGKVLKPVAKVLVLGDPLADEPEFLFAKMLILLMVFAIIWTALNRVEFFSGNSWVLFIVSFVASLLSVRWVITKTFIQTVILPYSVLGIAISAGLPFVIYFLLVNIGFKKAPSSLRRIAWIFFAVIFFGLWFVRKDDLVANIETGKFFIQNLYLIVALLSLVMVLFDGTVRRFTLKIQAEKIGSEAAHELMKDYKRKLAGIPGDLKEGVIKMPEAKRLRKKYLKEIKSISKQYS